MVFLSFITSDKQIYFLRINPFFIYRLPHFLSVK